MDTQPVKQIEIQANTRAFDETVEFLESLNPWEDIEEEENEEYQELNFD